MIQNNEGYTKKTKNGMMWLQSQLQWRITSKFLYGISEKYEYTDVFHMASVHCLGNMPAQGADRQVTVRKQPSWHLTYHCSTIPNVYDYKYIAYKSHMA